MGLESSCSAGGQLQQGFGGQLQQAYHGPAHSALPRAALKLCQPNRPAHTQPPSPLLTLGLLPGEGW